MTYSRVDDLLILHEGVRRFPYRDTVGKLTIGVGFNLDDVGLYPEEINFILGNRIRRLEDELTEALPWYDGLDEVRRAVLLDMAYNLGISGRLQFKRTLGSIQRGEYELASTQMLESKWSRQVGTRAIRLSDMMKTGTWPKEVL